MSLTPEDQRSLKELKFLSRKNLEDTKAFQRKHVLIKRAFRSLELKFAFGSPGSSRGPNILKDLHEIEELLDLVAYNPDEAEARSEKYNERLALLFRKASVKYRAPSKITGAGAAATKKTPVKTEGEELKELVKQLEGGGSGSVLSSPEEEYVIPDTSQSLLRTSMTRMARKAKAEEDSTFEPVHLAESFDTPKTSNTSTTAESTTPEARAQEINSIGSRMTPIVRTPTQYARNVLGIVSRTTPVTELTRGGSAELSELPESPLSTLEENIIIAEVEPYKRTAGDIFEIEQETARVSGEPSTTIEETSDVSASAREDIDIMTTSIGLARPVPSLVGVPRAFASPASDVSSAVPGALLTELPPTIGAATTGGSGVPDIAAEALATSVSGASSDSFTPETLPPGTTTSTTTTSTTKELPPQDRRAPETIPKYHLLPIKLFFDSETYPSWDLTLEKDLRSRTRDLSKEEINGIIDATIAKNGPDILVYRRKSDGDIQELIEVLELQFSLHRLLAKGPRFKMGIINLGQLEEAIKATGGSTGIGTGTSDTPVGTGDDLSAFASADGAGAGTGVGATAAITTNPFAAGANTDTTTSTSAANDTINADVTTAGANNRRKEILGVQRMIEENKLVEQYRNRIYYDVGHPINNPYVLAASSDHHRRNLERKTPVALPKNIFDQQAPLKSATGDVNAFYIRFRPY
jgi:hypothetical protein